MKKAIAYIFIFMLVSVTLGSPLSATRASLASPQKLLTGDVLYVGGNGPNNYTTIQGAINDAASGDTVFVYDDSSPYYERLLIDRSITLTGEEKHTTIIDGGLTNETPVLNITAPGVIVQGFTIQNSSATGWFDYDSGVIITADHVQIKGNIIKDHRTGIQIGAWIMNTTLTAHYCTIEENEITENNGFGITLLYGNSTNVSHNSISKNINGGISIAGYSNSNLISYNQIIDNKGTGVSIGYGADNTILRNNITRNRGGVYILDSHGNTIKENNIYRNGLRNAWMDSEVIVAVLTKTKPLQNTWDANYWGRARQLPKPILFYSNFLLVSLFLSMTLQFYILFQGEGYFLFIPLGFFLMRFDRNPASEPYLIPEI
jgi:parallel beta-helix repeat protein